MHEDFDCTGLPNLEKQIIGAKLGVVIFLADDMKTAVSLAMRAVIEHRNCPTTCSSTLLSCAASIR